MKKLESFDLKIIACICMFIDHFGAIFVYKMIMMHVSFIDSQMLIQIYYLLRSIGRIAFPIYCFVLVEGFCHTRSVIKYGIRLLFFAFISEIPFDLAFQGSFFDLTYNNVFFTLFLGLICMKVISMVMHMSHSSYQKLAMKVICGILALGFVLLMGYLAENVLCSDYGMSGVICIVLMYLFRNQKEFGYVLGVLATVVLNHSTIQFVALFGVLLICRYQGGKGRSWKYFFYLFYPLHLLLITALTQIIIG
ncbi:MAG: TraX family protein [Traorella sp.]